MDITNKHIDTTLEWLGEIEKRFDLPKPNENQMLQLIDVQADDTGVAVYDSICSRLTGWDKTYYTTATAALQYNLFANFNISIDDNTASYLLTYIKKGYQLELIGLIVGSLFENNELIEIGIFDLFPIEYKTIFSKTCFSSDLLDELNGRVKDIKFDEDDSYIKLTRYERRNSTATN